MTPSRATSSPDQLSDVGDKSNRKMKSRSLALKEAARKREDRAERGENAETKHTLSERQRGKDNDSQREAQDSAKYRRRHNSTLPIHYHRYLKMRRRDLYERLTRLTPISLSVHVVNSLSFQPLLVLPSRDGDKIDRSSTKDS